MNHYTLKLQAETEIAFNDLGGTTITTVVDGVTFNGRGEFFSGTKEGDKGQAVIKIFGAQTDSPIASFGFRRDPGAATLVVKPDMLEWPDVA